MTMERGSLVNKRYRIVEILGQGGMAAVYRAIDENLGVEVALKENLFTTEEYARQFRLEATILASLRQANLPRVSDHFVIEQQGQYLVMDYIEGEDLRQRMDRLGQLPEQEVIIVGVAICDALTYMHSRKPMVLHRDIKPGNVRITPLGHIFLVDFGLAKIVQGKETTSTGARAMTPGYSPPEQYGTARTDHRSDIYSLGATLYSALTDQLPEDGLARAMGQAKLTPVSKHNSRISQNLAQVIEKSLEVRPDDRYQNAEEVRLDLMNARSTTRRKQPIELVLTPPPVTLNTKFPGDEENQDIDGEEEFEDSSEFLAASEQDGTPDDTSAAEAPGREGVSKRPRRLGWIFLGGFILVLVAALIAFISDPGIATRTLALLQPRISTTQQMDDSTATAEMFLRTATETSRRQPLTTVEPSPTHTLVPRPTQIIRPTSTLTPTIAPTLVGGGIGQIAFVSDRSGSAEIFLVNIDGSGLTQITSIPEGACQPRWSPDGQRIAFISPCGRDMDTYAGSSLFIMDADGSNRIPIQGPPGGDFDPSWSPDGTKIAFTSLRGDGVPSIYILDLNDNSVEPFGDSLGRYNADPVWSPDGSMVAYVGWDYRIYAMDLDGEEGFPLIVGGGNYYNSNPIWAPDGSVVMFSRVSADNTSGVPSLWAVPFTVDGAISVEVPNSSYVLDPSISPDGFWLVFKSWTSGSHDIYLMRTNGTDREPLITDPAYDFDPVWRP